MPRIAVICTVLNEVETIDELMKSIVEQELKPQEFIIVDGGSRDGTWDRILSWKEKFEKKRIRFKAIREEGANIARGRNIAIRNTGCELIASIDGGCVAHREWLKELLSKYRPGVVVAGNFKPLAERWQEKIQAVFVRPSAPDNPSSRSVLFERKAWERVGGYPEHLYTGEDTLFNQKLRENGYRFVFAEKAVVYWRMRRSLWKWLKQYYRYGFGDGLALNLNPSTTYGRKLIFLLALFYSSLLLPRYLLPTYFFLCVLYGLKRSFSVYGLAGGFLLPFRYLSFLIGFHTGLLKRLTSP